MGGHRRQDRGISRNFKSASPEEEMFQPQGFFQLSVKGKIPVLVVAEDGMAMHGHMAPDLVGAAAPQLCLKQGKGLLPVLSLPKTRKACVVGTCAERLSPDDEVIRIDAFVVRRSPGAYSPVKLADASFAELCRPSGTPPRRSWQASCSRRFPCPNGVPEMA